MKTTKNITFFLLVTIITFYSCEPEDGEGIFGGSNNNISEITAQEISVSNSLIEVCDNQSLDLDGRTEDQYYLLKISNPGPINVKLIPELGDGNFSFSVFESGANTEGSKYIPAGSSGSLWINIQQQDYILRVSGESTENYCLEIWQNIEEFEWNHTCQRASTIQLNQEINASLLGVSEAQPNNEVDVDWYSIELTEIGTYKLDVPHTPSDVKVRFRVYNECDLSDYLAYAYTTTPGISISNEFQITEPGTFSIFFEGGLCSVFCSGYVSSSEDEEYSFSISKL